MKGVGILSTVVTILFPTVRFLSRLFEKGFGTHLHDLFTGVRKREKIGSYVVAKAKPLYFVRVKHGTRPTGSRFSGQVYVVTISLRVPTKVRWVGDGNMK